MKVFNQVAKINNVTPEKVRDEITLALTFGLVNKCAVKKSPK